MARKLWNINNVLTTLKAIVVSLVVGIIPFLLMLFIRLIENPPGWALAIFGIISFAYMIFSFWLWGYYANKWFGFK